MSFKLGLLSTLPGWCPSQGPACPACLWGWWQQMRLDPDSVKQFCTSQVFLEPHLYQLLRRNIREGRRLPWPGYSPKCSRHFLGSPARALHDPQLRLGEPMISAPRTGPGTWQGLSLNEGRNLRFWRHGVLEWMEFRDLPLPFKNHFICLVLTVLSLHDHVGFSLLQRMGTPR